MVSQEQILQEIIFRYFEKNYQEYKMLFCHVPNGGNRNILEAMAFKRGGVVAGVADFIFLYRTEKYGYACFELKTNTGRQSDKQKNFERQVTILGGGVYYIIRSKQQFVDAIEQYLS